MEHITYTDTQGKVTSFDSSSASDAMGRLMKIDSYRGGFMDSVASGLASGYAAKNKNASRISNIVAENERELNERSSAMAMNKNRVSSQSVIVGLEVKNGKLMKVMQDQFISSDGSVHNTGSRREVSVYN